MSALPDLERLVAAVAEDAASDDPLERLAAAARVRDDLEELAEALLDTYVEGAREAGCSWSQIGRALGVTRQAAQQRHSATKSIARRLLAWLPTRRHGGHGSLFGGFTDRAREAVVHARHEARALQHNYIGTEHVLLGVLLVPEGVAARALGSMGVSAPAVRDQIVALIGRGEVSPAGHIPFTPRAKKVLELSLRESLRLGHNYIGTEHVLLGIVREGEGVAAQILANLGADPDRTRDAIERLLA